MPASAPAEQDVETPQTDAIVETEQDTTQTPEGVTDASEGLTEEPETFPREYVERLRKENGDNRVKAKRADDLAHRLHTVLVEKTGKLADATDLPYSEDHLDDPDALEAAIDDLLTRKAHLASRKPSGDIGQGVQSPDDSVSLAGILRSNAR